MSSVVPMQRTLSEVNRLKVDLRMLRQDRDYWRERALAAEGQSDEEPEIPLPVAESRREMRLALRAVYVLGGVVAIGAALLLAGCDQSVEVKEQAPDTPMPVKLVAVAPDGTHLWLVSNGGRFVYFASTGTSTTESCGKHCIRAVDVPTGSP